MECLLNCLVAAFALLVGPVIIGSIIRNRRRFQLILSSWFIAGIVLTEIGTCATAFLQEWTIPLVVIGSILFLTALIAGFVGIFLNEG